MAFEEESDAGAFDIRATGVGCDVARDIAREVQGQVGERYIHPAGFTCRTEGASGELPSYPYRCTSGTGERVTFDAS